MGTLGLFLLRLTLGLGLFKLTLGLRLLRLTLLVLALRLGILEGLDLTESVFQVGMLDVLFLDRGVEVGLLLWCSNRVLNHQDLWDRVRRVNIVRVVNHLDFRVRLRRVELAFSIGNLEAAGQDLGADIVPRAGEFAFLPLNGGTDLESVKLLKKALGRDRDGPLLVVELRPKLLQGLLELTLESLHDLTELLLDGLPVDFLLLSEPEPIRVGLHALERVVHAFVPDSCHLPHIITGNCKHECLLP